MGDIDIPVLYKRKDLCCGFAACFSICPRKAISMQEDEEGFEYPIIIEEKCIGCHMCVRVCPISLSHP